MQQLETRGITDSWIQGSWEEYLAAINNFPENKGKSYYYNGYYRLEMTPIGFEHARDHHVVFLGVSLYAILKEIPFQGLPTCSYRKRGIREVQPDISYYLGEKANLIPSATSIIDLNQYPPPDLVIDPQIFAFEIIDRGSKRIDISKVLPNLKLAVLESALQQARTGDQSQVGRWLISQFQG
ncbi:MAG: Uma2 family endonuclease [Microcystis aeruginosa L111-01]|nr:Uma2 family endonuclease [Microcystis aeruginosa L111-01]